MLQISPTDWFFAIWSLLWLVWALAFTALAMLGSLYLVTAVGFVGFIVLWIRYCDGMSRLKQKTHPDV